MDDLEFTLSTLRGKNIQYFIHITDENFESVKCSEGNAYSTVICTRVSLLTLLNRDIGGYRIFWICSRICSDFGFWIFSDNWFFNYLSLYFININRNFNACIIFYKCPEMLKIKFSFINKEILGGFLSIFFAVLWGWVLSCQPQSVRHWYVYLMTKWSGTAAGELTTALSSISPSILILEVNLFFNTFC